MKKIVLFLALVVYSLFPLESHTAQKIISMQFDINNGTLFTYEFANRNRSNIFGLFTKYEANKFILNAGYGINFFLLENQIKGPFIGGELNTIYEHKQAENSQVALKFYASVGYRFQIRNQFIFDIFSGYFFNKYYMGPGVGIKCGALF